MASAMDGHYLWHIEVWEEMNKLYPAELNEAINNVAKRKREEEE